MKIKLILICLLSLLAVPSVFAKSKTVQLTINWTFLNVNEGYDHDNKIIVTVDGEAVGESRVFKQTNRSSYTISIPKGKHEIRVMDYAYYESKWEEHKKENGYSIDAYYEGILDCQANITIDMTFDIDTETADIQVSGAKAAKGSAVPLKIAWKYTHVKDGYEYDNRVIVYIDGKKVATSAIFAQSKLGTIVVDVPLGNHEILIESYALYQGKWELHSRENEYSIDAVYTTNMSFEKKKRSVNLIFDIDTEQTTAVVK
jgi:hypothetical protein